MDTLCEGTMGAAEIIFEPQPASSGSSEAKVRIQDARVSELAFIVRKITSFRLDDDDVILLATVLAKALSNSQSFTRQHIESELRAAGRSASKAAQLAGAIIK